MPVQYYFDSLDPVSFQRLINALLVARYGERIRLLPLRGSDGQRDAETAPTLAAFEIKIDNHVQPLSNKNYLEPGRHIFQVKHHRSADRVASVVRSAVITDFDKELSSDLLSRATRDPVNYFHLITNVSSSKDAISQIDQKRRKHLADMPDLHADVLWQEHVIAWLDGQPEVWNSFPELFAGMQIPLLGRIADISSTGVSSSMRMALAIQSKRDSLIRFQQIDLEQSLSKLFVDLEASYSTSLFKGYSIASHSTEPKDLPVYDIEAVAVDHFAPSIRRGTCIPEIISESLYACKKLLLEGGPGQGKSTITQMVAQIYRSLLLGNKHEYDRVVTGTLKSRFPFRIELRLYGEWLAAKGGTIEEYLSYVFTRDAGGAQITAKDIHSIAEQQPVIIILDGLDEVGSDELRDAILQQLLGTIERFEELLKSDLKVLLTSRPPAIQSRLRRIPEFVVVRLASLGDKKIIEYTQRWADTLCPHPVDHERVVGSFDRRKREEHVAALIKNPMQLSVLLHFIKLKGEAFPDKRAELYRDYFRTVIDRDVEKSPKFRERRSDIEALHELIGFGIHVRAERDLSSGSLSYDELIMAVEHWLAKQGRDINLARELFSLGEERLGLIVVLRGEGTESRYGFSVQPIREYFAAAFINDKSELDAHDLFGKMARRPFWREVALFLAGLRRANEKADLLSRAKTLDENNEHEWRGDGRSIVLQLLLEGVLTTPGHVHTDALCFLIKSFDTTNCTPFREPSGLLEHLPRLIKACDSSQPRSELIGLLAKSSITSDRAALRKLWQIANTTLSATELEILWLKYVSYSNELNSQVKMVWPAEARLSTSAFLSQYAVLPKEADSTWAQYWFESVFSDQTLTGLELTPVYHELLFEQFAFQPIQREEYIVTIESFHPNHPYAIWCLVSNIREIGKWLIGSNPRTISPCANVDYTGLGNVTGNCARRLIEASTATLTSLQAGRKKGWALKGFLQVINEVLSMDGIYSWIACRCAVTLMAYLEAPRFIKKDDRLERIWNTDRPFVTGLWQELRRNLLPFFHSAIHHGYTRRGYSRARKIVQYGLHMVLPSHIRINGIFVAAPKIVTEQMGACKSSELLWLDHAPIPQYWFPDMFRNRLTVASVATLFKRKLLLYGPKARMFRKEIRKLLSLVNTSEDPAFLTGALAVLVGSRFWDLFDSEMILKMIKADPAIQDISPELFKHQQYIRSVHKMPHATCVGIANAIVKHTSVKSKSVGAAAAQFLFQQENSKLPPLNLSFVCSK